MLCDFPLYYLCQIGRNFWTQFKEHIQAIQVNKQNSKFASYILDMQQTWYNSENNCHTSYKTKRGPFWIHWNAFTSYYTKTSNELTHTRSYTTPYVIQLLNISHKIIHHSLTHLPLSLKKKTYLIPHFHPPNIMSDLTQCITSVQHNRWSNNSHPNK
jgi:hypothetical protein